jgi:hypothetical protein
VALGHIVKEQDAAGPLAAPDERQVGRRQELGGGAGDRLDRGERTDALEGDARPLAAEADASHRGGPPGFLDVSENRVSWEDFPGNNMFNTIGNLLVGRRCGLLFVDFEGGGTLQIAGRPSVQWEPKRAVAVEITSVVE